LQPCAALGTGKIDTANVRAIAMLAKRANGLVSDISDFLHGFRVTFTATSLADCDKMPREVSRMTKK
jgi:hypothetical protein